MKLKKKSGLMGAVIALSAASLVSVGFASWVISQGAEANVTGQIVVDTVDDQRLGLSAVISGTPIRFGGLSAADEAALTGTGGSLNGKEIWLSNNSTDKENLEFDVELTFTSSAEGGLVTDLSKYNIVFTLEAGTLSGTNFTKDETDYNAAVSAGYVTSLDTVKATAHTEATALDSNGKVSYNFKFAWGSFFKPTGYANGVNPYEFYNLQEYNSTVADGAKDALEDLNDLLDGVAFKLTIKANLI